MPGGVSHVLEVLQIVDRLGERGHKAALLLEDWDLEAARPKIPLHHPDETFLTISLYNTTEEGRQNFMHLVANQDESLDGLKLFFSHQYNQCKRLLGNKKAMETIKGYEADLFIADITYPCSLMLADILDLPYIFFCPTTIIEPIHSNLFGYLALPSGVPMHATGLEIPQSFSERAMNWVASTMTGLIVKPRMAQIHEDLRSEFNVPVRNEAPKLALFNADFAIEYPRPTPDGIKMVGPLLAAPAKPLTGDLAEIVNNSGPDGFIFVSFGSVYVLKTAVEVKTMAAALSSLNRTVLWKLSKKDLPQDVSMEDLNLSALVHTINWAPQNDVLGSNKLAAFVSHGGTNSVYESAYHGAPVVNIPFMGDHHDHARRAEAKGFGVTVPWSSLTCGNSAPLVAAIEKVITNANYKQAAEAVGAQLRAYPKAPADRAAEWVEYAMALPRGTSLALADPAAKLNWFARYSHDVHAVLIAALGVLGVIGYKVVRFILGKVMPGRKNRKSTNLVGNGTAATKKDI